MWYPAQLVYRNYEPKFLQKGMLFINISHEGTEKEEFEIFSLDRIPRDEQAFISINGFPIELLIINPENENIIAEHDQISWFDFGDKMDHLIQISLKEINIILNQFNSWLDVLIEEEEFVQNDEVIPVIDEDFVIVRFYEEEEYEEDDDDDDELEEEEE